MNVVYFVGTLEAGGLERFVSRVCKMAMDLRLFKPSVVCLNRRQGIFLNELEAAGVPVFEAPARWFRSPSRWRALVKLLKELQPDIVHSQVNYSMVQQLLAVRYTGSIYTVTERNCYERRGMALLRRRFQYRILRSFGITYSANSEKVAHHLAAMLKVPVGSFPILRNGVEITSKQVSHLNNGSVNEPVLIAYVARMAPHKGHLFFLAVLNELVHSQGLNCRAVIVGDGPIRTEIEQAIGNWNLNEHVLLTGVVPNAESYIQDADIAALLSDFEGMPNVVIEAMAAGKPVVATDVGNTLELLGSGAGFILKHKDVSEAAELFRQLVVAPEIRGRMGEQGRQLIVQRYSLSGVVNRLNDYYQTLVFKS